MRVAVCGLGRMGSAFTGNLVADGHEVTVWNRTPRRPEGVSVRVAAEPAEAAREVDVVVVMVFDGPAAESVLTGQHGVISGAAPGTLVINSTTLDPGESRHLDRAVRAAGPHYLEAPVLGSVPAVRSRSLRVLTGGSPEDATAAEPVLNAWSTTEGRHHAGPVGRASALKLVANLALGTVYSGLHEAVSLGADLGVARDEVLDVLGYGPLGSAVAGKRDRLDHDHYEGADFALGALAKDMALAVEAARSAGHPLTVVEAIDRLAARWVDRGEGELDLSGLGRTPDHARPPGSG